MRRRISILMTSSPRTRGDGPRTLPLVEYEQVLFSPHTRGWPDSLHRAEHLPDVLPAHAGMARRLATPWRQHHRSPRTRGDGPPWRAAIDGQGQRSPRTRGDGPRPSPSPRPDSSVLPAHAGMARHRFWSSHHMDRSPRTRGDGPNGGFTDVTVQLVLPAHAGMARATCWTPSPSPSVLPAHAGMARVKRIMGQALRLFSPHTRGWPGPCLQSE